MSKKMPYKKLIAGFVIAAIASMPVSALAYPPGKPVAVNLSSRMVKAKSEVNATIVNAKVGIVTFGFKKVINYNSNSSYEIPASFAPKYTGTYRNSITIRTTSSPTSYGLLAPVSSGVYRISVTDSDQDVASNTLFIPSVSVPSSVKVGRTSYVTVNSASPGSLVTVKVGSKSYKARVGSNAQAVVAFKITSKSIKKVSVTVGSLSYKNISVRTR